MEESVPGRTYLRASSMRKAINHAMAAVGIQSPAWKNHLRRTKYWQIPMRRRGSEDATTRASRGGLSSGGRNIRA